MTAFQAEGCSGGFAADFKKAGPPPPVISTEAKRSGEISPSDGTGSIMAGDLSTQSIIKAFSLCPIPTRSSARDDGGDEQHPVISEEDETHSRHFDRSGAEWRNLTPHGTGGITVGNLSTQSIMGAFSICPIPTCSPARDDGVSEQHWTHLRCEGSKDSKGGGLPSRAMSFIMPPFGGHVHIEYHNHSYPRTSLRHFVALFP